MYINSSNEYLFDEKTLLTFYRFLSEIVASNNTLF